MRQHVMRSGASLVLMRSNSLSATALKVRNASTSMTMVSPLLDAQTHNIFYRMELARNEVPAFLKEGPRPGMEAVIRVMRTWRALPSVHDSELLMHEDRGPPTSPRCIGGWSATLGCPRYLAMPGCGTTL